MLVLWVTLPLPILLLVAAPRMILVDDDLAPVVKVTGGVILGRVVSQPGARVSQYYAFEGIPYARPPVGERRFKDPEEVEPWNGIRNATATGSVCVQKDILSPNGTMSGDENCLFLNVFTADPPGSWLETKRAVAVFVHGGAFIAGSGDMDCIRPDSLMRQGLVVVSFNYRLGVLGFLNTEDQEAPGNAGLKDAVQALRWVQLNIKAFGGNPERVTIIGESAGAAMVHYLLLTPLTKGLVHRAIAMSGDALCPWAAARRPRRDARALRQHLSAACPDDAPEAIASCLRRVDARELVANQDQAPSEELMFRFWKNPFLPSVEASGSSDAPLLTVAPEQLMREGNFLKVPFIKGFTSAEGILYVAFAGLLQEPSLWSSVDESFVERFRWEMPPGLRGADALRKLRDFYMGDRAIRDASDDPEALRRFVQMMTDMLFAAGSVNSARLMSEAGAPVWVYEFTHEGPAPFFKNFFYNASHVPGVAHGEDLTYVFDLGRHRGALPLQQPLAEVAVRDRVVRLVADFASTGNPTPEGSEQPTWPPYSADNETYMEMGTSFTIKGHVLGDRIAMWRSLADCEVAGVCDEQPVVVLEQGALRGRRATSAAGCAYYSFQGVPYAQPPTGALRFKDALPPKPWQGVRDALQEGHVCPQKYHPNAKMMGQEDCLFANVYTPLRPPSTVDPLPVLVWFHGGGFVVGSGNSDECGPDYFVCEDVILVTINYRLGPLGFLYLAEAAPGNAGLKDQTMALRWVQRNIAAFGGDSAKVTIAGQSAGAASVHMHMLSPMTKGLFQRAIAQSGTALGQWALQKSPAEIGRRLASFLNCSAGDAFAVAECLRQVPPEGLIAASQSEEVMVLDNNRTMYLPFVPIIDRPVPAVETFLPDSPLQLITKGLHHRVPFLIGFTIREELIKLAHFRNATRAKEMDSFNFWDTRIFPYLRLSSNTSRKEDVLGTLRRFYMDGKPLSNDTIFGFMEMIGDISPGEEVFYSLKHMAEVPDVALYAYSFSVDDDLNMLKMYLNMTDLPGAAHSDDLGYMFHMQDAPEVENNSSAALARRRMVRMWTNFMKTGDPTPYDDPLLGVRWKAYKSEEHNSIDIGSELTPRPNFFPKRQTFWETFYDSFTDK